MSLVKLLEVANPDPCENNPQNVNFLHPDSDLYSVTTGDPTIKGPSSFFDPTQMQTAIRPNTFTAQDECMHSEQ